MEIKKFPEKSNLEQFKEHAVQDKQLCARGEVGSKSSLPRNFTNCLPSTLNFQIFKSRRWTIIS